MPVGLLSAIEQPERGGVGRLDDIESSGQPSVLARARAAVSGPWIHDPWTRGFLFGAPRPPESITIRGQSVPLEGPGVFADDPGMMIGPRGALAAATAVRKIFGVHAPVRIAEAVAPTGINPYMKGPAAQPVRSVSMRDLIQPPPGNAAVAPVATMPSASTDVAAVSLKPKITSGDFLRGMRQLEAARANPPKTWPVSTSKLNPSDIPGLTTNDVEFLRRSGFTIGAEPTPEAVAALIRGRVLRTAAHRTGAERGAEEALRRVGTDESGFTTLGVTRTLGGASVGGALGASQNPDNPALGGVAGATIGAAATNPMMTLRALNQLRHINMLSGLAVPKSLLNDIGAPVNAAAEMKSLAPITEALRLPTNIKNYWVALKEGIPYQGVERPISQLNIFGRQMGAADAATRAALERGGVTIADANRLLNQTPLQELGIGGQTAKVLRGAGNVFYPYTRNAFNQFVHGFTPRSQSMAALYGGAGVATGSQTDDPISVGLLSALAGPYALPFVGGAALSSGKLNLFGQLSPLPEYGLATNPLHQFEPALLRYLRR